jgi:hypothetical protein
LATVLTTILPPGLILGVMGVLLAATAAAAVTVPELRLR